jgi:23S rRNA G2069 N7-methylase RlmK/C1962 C5-methylase RlmI
MRPANGTLYHADAMAVLERLDGGLFTLVYVDPPRGTTRQGETDLAEHKQFISRLIQQCRRVLNDHGALYFHVPAVSSVNYRLILDQIFQKTCSLAIIWGSSGFSVGNLSFM